MVKSKKCYVLMVSKNFPATHPRKGEETKFIEKIRKGIKKHTIRGNYWFWKKRIAEIKQGKAYLSLRQWSAKPYCSPQIEIMQLTNVDVERLDHNEFGYQIECFGYPYDDRDFARNDGLILPDFKAWFKKAEYPMAIIHFTDFRYHISKNN